MFKTEYGEDSVFPECIESDRLYFKPFHLTDLTKKDVFDFFSNVSFYEMIHVTFSPFETIIEAQYFLSDEKVKYKEGERVTYFIFEKETDEWIGVTGLDPDWDRKLMESWIFLTKEYWGDGYGTERGEAFVKLAFYELGCEVWLSKCKIGNRKSKKSIEKYVVDNGGEYVGVIPNISDLSGNTFDVHTYKIKKENCSLSL